MDMFRHHHPGSAAFVHQGAGAASGLGVSLGPVFGPGAGGVLVIGAGAGVGAGTGAMHATDEFGVVAAEDGGEHAIRAMLARAHNHTLDVERARRGFGDEPEDDDLADLYKEEEDEDEEG